MCPSCGFRKRLPKSLRRASLDSSRALNLVAASYSANAYPFSPRHQNCNQWVAEMLAVAWGDLADGDDLRGRAQGWLREAHYAPEPVDVGSHALMFASMFVPFLYLDDHPEEDQFAMKAADQPAVDGRSVRPGTAAPQRTY